jgi:chromosome segregation ATPase
MPKTMDFEATREKLREQIDQAELKLVDARDLVGELALDVQLGNASQAELDKAVNEQATLTARIDGLKAALEKVDEREAASVAAEAEKQRQADEKRLAELQRVCDAAGAKVIDLATQLGAVLAEGHAAVQEADTLGRRLGVSPVAIQRWSSTAHKVISARIGGGGGFFPGEQAAAERALTGGQ